MRYVNFIKSLNVQQLPLAGDTIRYYNNNKATPIFKDDGSYNFLDTTEFIKEEIVPINRISRIERGERVDTYIAYSKEVEELIEIPFMAIKEELNRAHTYKRKIETATVLNRLLYLFTGKLR